MIENIIISFYIAIIALYFRHSIYHVFIVYALSCFFLIDFNSIFTLYDCLPSIIFIILYLIISKQHRRCECHEDSLGPQILRPLIFIAVSYRVFDMSVNIPLGAIRMMILSDFINVGFVWFDQVDYLCHFSDIRHIYMSYALVIILFHRLYFLASLFFIHYIFTHIIHIF